LKEKDFMNHSLDTETKDEKPQQSSSKVNGIRKHLLQFLESLDIDSASKNTLMQFACSEGLSESFDMISDLKE